MITLGEINLWYDKVKGNTCVYLTQHQAYPDLPVIAGKDSPLVTKTPSHKSTFKLGEDVVVTALHTPCHTQDSICYYVEDSTTGERGVFTGDTLFIAGCGRFFEGSANDMNKALNQVLGSLPDDTKVYPGHEYTAGNVKFAKTVLDNESLNNLEDFLTKSEVTTGHFTIKDEKSFNPFMRLHDSQIKNALGLSEEIEIMNKLRELKNKM